MNLAKKIFARFPDLEHRLNAIYHRWHGIPPVVDAKITKKLIREFVDKEDPTILEIGCNDGRHTLWFLELFQNPKIYCFEPDPRAIARFKENVGQRPNVHLFDIALSDHNGEVEFFQSNGYRNENQIKRMPDGWDLSGSIRQPKDHLVVHPWVKFDQKIGVTASTLDTWCREHGIGDIDFIWMDVQGAEIDVFRGGKNTLSNTRFIYTEYSNQELYEGQFNLVQLMKYLRRFRVMIRYPGDVLIRNKKMVAKPNKSLKRMLDSAPLTNTSV